MRTEPEIRGTLVGSTEGIRSAHLSGGVNFAWNVGGSIRPPTGGGCAAPPFVGMVRNASHNTLHAADHAAGHAAGHAVQNHVLKIMYPDLGMPKPCS